MLAAKKLANDDSLPIDDICKLKISRATYDRYLAMDADNGPSEVVQDQFKTRFVTYANVLQILVGSDDSSAARQNRVESIPRMEGFETPNRMAFRHNRLEASTTIEILTTIAVDP